MNSNLHKIDHIVVLMLENRSFDNMLGWLGASDGGRQRVNGVAGKDLSNPVPAFARPSKKHRSIPVGKETVMTHPNPDPGEEYPRVNTQLFGRVIPNTNRHSPFNLKPYNLPSGKLPDPAPMNGFVHDYINNFIHICNRMPRYDEYKIIMNCFTEESIPVLSTLAKEYAVFDAWHASVPSQTWCNRSFMHAATSHGYVLNEPYYNWLLHDKPTIFNRIEDKKELGLTWKIYYDKLDIISLTGLQNPALWKYHHSNFKYLNHFYKDARQGKLPNYSFLEPRMFIDHSDQHPQVGKRILETSSVLAGEILIRDVYEAVRNGPKWDQTLLIITYDEHGGCYDHVSPPAAISPEPDSTNHQMDFHFDRLGIRVPTVMISPYIKKGTVVSDVHDHTSILKMIEDRWGLESLTERDKNAKDFSTILRLDTPRTNCPTEIKARYYEVTKKVREEPINDLQKGMLFVIAGYEAALKIERDENLFKKAEDLFQLVREEGRIAHIETVGDAIDFLTDFDHRTTRRLSFLEWLWRKTKRMFE